MLKVCVIGIGAMGSGHVINYVRLALEGAPVKLVALCDVDEGKFIGDFVKGNIEMGSKPLDLGQFNLYTDYMEMIRIEQPDYVDIALPTYLHSEVTVACLNAGVHVMCEKPMARNVMECQAMIDASRINNKKLMISQCLRFWPAYEHLKMLVDSKKYGKAVCGSFFRGGSTPMWSWQNWLLDGEKSGGCLLDQHIHDVDMINWLFGKPVSVSSIGAKNIKTKNGYDAVSTNYIYENNLILNAQDDWTINGDFGFNMIFRVNFENGSLHLLPDGKLMEYPHDGKAIDVELSPDDGYYREIKYFISALINNTPIVTADIESTMDTIEIAEAELASADRMGKVIEL